MMRNVYLEGEMGEKFGTKFQMSAPKVSDVIKCMDCNHPSFKQYLMDCHNNDIGFEIDVANNKLDYEAEMLMNLQEGDVTITPIPAGSKSGGQKILAAIAIFALMAATGGLTGMGGTVTTTTPFAAGGGVSVTVPTVAGNAGWAVAAGGGLNTVGFAGAMIAVNLGMMGLSQLMAPDPATDSDQEQSYLFNGSQQNIVEGDPVPVLYGRLRVPGQPVNFEVAAAKVNNYRFVSLNRDGTTGKG
jgi:predicted phage tail protein